MKQYDIFGKVIETEEDHPQIEGKKINKNYFGSGLNRFCAENCRKDIIVNNIDLIINDYKNNSIRIIESKHENEKLSIGQELLLKRLSKAGIATYCIYGDPPYDTARIHSFQLGKTKKVSQKSLIKFLNNQK